LEPVLPILLLESGKTPGAVDKFLGYNDEGEGGVRQEIWYDERTDTLTFKDVQDCTQILEDNRRQLNDEHGKPFGEWKKIATIPNIVINQLIKEGIWGDRVRFKKWLNKSEYSKFRTKEGQL